MPFLCTYKRNFQNHFIIINVVFVKQNSQMSLEHTCISKDLHAISMYFEGVIVLTVQVIRNIVFILIPHPLYSHQQPVL